MGKFTDLFKSAFKTPALERVTTPIKTDKVSAPTRQYPDGYYEFEDKHSDRIFNKLEKYADLCSDVETTFDEYSNYSKRVSSLKKAISFFEKLKQEYYEYGEYGEILFNEEAAAYLKEPDLSKIIINSVNSYENEFYNMSFELYPFLKYLYDSYTANKESIVEHIKKEEYFYNCDAYGGEEEYKEQLEYEKVIDGVYKNVKSHSGILQKDFVKLYDEQYQSDVKSELKRLSDNGLITKTKSGNTYQLDIVSK